MESLEEADHLRSGKASLIEEELLVTRVATPEPMSMKAIGSVGGYEVTFENVLRKFTHLLKFTDLRTYVHSLLVMHALLDSR